MAYIFQIKGTVDVRVHSLRYLKDGQYISDQGYSMYKRSQLKVPVRWPIYFRSRLQRKLELTV